MAVTAKNIIVLGSATLSRLLGTLLLYALIARAFGPQDFGEFAFWYSIGIVCGALSDYGFAQQLLINLASKDEADAKNQAEDIVFGKFALVASFYSILVVALVVVTTDFYHFVWVSALLASTAAATLIEFFGVMLRARGKYEAESIRTFISTFGANSIAAVCGYFSENMLLVCFAMFGVRIVVCVFQYKAARECVKFNFSIFNIFDARRLLKVLRNGFLFAIDGAAVQLISNVDLLMAKLVLTPGAIGLYLAGTRLVQAALAGIPVLANIFVPQMVSAKENGIDKVPRLLIYLVLIVAAGAFGICYLFSEAVPRVMFGPEFNDMKDFMPLIGLIVAVRYVGSIDGFLLSVNYKQKARAVIHLTLLSMFLLGAVVYFYNFSVEPKALASFTLLLWVLVLLVFRVVALNSKMNRG